MRPSHALVCRGDASSPPPFSYHLSRSLPPSLRRHESGRSWISSRRCASGPTRRLRSCTAPVLTPSVIRTRCRGRGKANPLMTCARSARSSNRCCLRQGLTSHWASARRSTNRGSFLRGSRCADPAPRPVTLILPITLASPTTRHFRSRSHVCY
ncbi:hypothetical protein EDB89DRAFT_616354 [Lactarius sanguifluus]|nr:hypothetical protein EDB89DRAFT_616354 [Lactarius sanguifluus]